jgi:hypothetical protein
MMTANTCKTMVSARKTRAVSEYLACRRSILKATTWRATTPRNKMSAPDTQLAEVMMPPICQSISTRPSPSVTLVRVERSPMTEAKVPERGDFGRGRAAKRRRPGRANAACLGQAGHTG